MAAVAFLLAATLAAQTPWRTGEVIDPVELPDQPGQTYALYIPSGYAPDRAWPILYCLDPGARGRIPVERFAAAAEKAGVLVAGSNNSRNGPLRPSQDAIHLMLADTHKRLNIDDSRIYAAGFSGGARLALGWAMAGRLAGVIASSAGFLNSAVPKQVPFRIFFTTGSDDFNHDEIYRLSRALAGRGIPHHYVEFEGGHEWLPVSLTAEALAYLAGVIPPRAAEPSKQAGRDADSFQRRIREIESAGDAGHPALVQRLQKDASGATDSPERRVARRVTGSLSMGSAEEASEAMSQHQYSDAARYASIAVLVRPENGGAWFTLAVARAALGDTRRSLEALEQALAHGFRARDRIESEPLLDKVRRKKKYAELMK
jgi:dienelactone hydrolase